MTLLRHVLAIALLPFMVVVVVPAWLLRASFDLPAEIRAAPSVVVVPGRVLGAALGVAGIALFVWCVSLFARVGRGTLAPWDPTRQLVVVGPYRHVRNPMITAVATILAAETLVYRSPRLGAWLVLFVALNHLYFLLSEEPGLRRRFGAEYVRYQRAVPRWIPRWRAWRDDTAGATTPDE